MIEPEAEDPAERCDDGAGVLVQRCADLFTTSYGSEPDGVWSAPGRVNLIGEHTDYNNGYVLPFAIEHRAAVAVRRRSDRVIEAMSSAFPNKVSVSLDDLAPRAASGWSAYPLGVAWALRTMVGDNELPGLEIFIDSQVPTGSGLSSSAALECAVAVAIDDLWKLGRTRTELALDVQRAENIAVGSPTGIMDQFASLEAETGCAVFIDCHSHEIRQVPLGLQNAGISVIVINTRQQHANSASGYADRRASCERGASLLGVASLREVGLDDLDRAAAILDDVTFRRVRHIVTENDRVLQTVAALAGTGPTAIGPLLNDSHRSMRDDFEISTPALDLAVSTAQEAGALGARLTGGGFGGSAIALAPESELGPLAAAIRGSFAAAAFQTPEVSCVSPSRKAGRDR